jgi:hypothetical protein
MCGPTRQGAPSSDFRRVRPVSTRIRRRGRDQYLRRPWLRVEALPCARHELFLVEDCRRCGARGFGFMLLDGAARLVCRRCAAVVHHASVESRGPSSGEKAHDRGKTKHLARHRASRPTSTKASKAGRESAAWKQRQMRHN